MNTKVLGPKPDADARDGSKVRQTRDGLRAEYNRRDRLWYYYRWDVSENRYVETGSTRRFEP